MEIIYKILFFLVFWLAGGLLVMELAARLGAEAALKDGVSLQWLLALLWPVTLMIMLCDLIERGVGWIFRGMYRRLVDHWDRVARAARKH